MIKITEAAKQLKISPATLRRYCREGMPHNPGKKGRGHSVMVDPQIVIEWVGASTDTHLAMRLADETSKVLARSVWECWQRATVLNQRREAGIFAAIWFQCKKNMLDHLREMDSDIPGMVEGESHPEEIEALLKITRGE